jgi:hypothetical protein
VSVPIEQDAAYWRKMYEERLALQEDGFTILLADRDRLRTALEEAKRALYFARCGLDLGLGCARDLEDDRSPRATKPRSRRQEEYLEDARKAHRAVTAALNQERRP